MLLKNVPSLFDSPKSLKPWGYSTGLPLRGVVTPGLLTDAGFSAADREASLELIKLDISRTFPSLCIFQQVSGGDLSL